MEIKPHIGLDELRFGASRTEATNLVGNPEQIEPDDYGNGDSTLAWYYWARGYSLHFDSYCDFRLESIELNSEVATLFGQSLCNFTREDVLGLIAESGLQHELIDDRGIVIHELSLNFWFEDELLESIQWSVKINEQDSPEWPD